MLQVTSQMRVLVVVEPEDFRKGIDGLARACREALDEDPFSGALFVFRNRRATAVKVLVYDGQGFWLCQKRLSRGRFSWWPRSGAGVHAQTLASHELGVLLAGGDPRRARGMPMWREVSVRAREAMAPPA